MTGWNGLVKTVQRFKSEEDFKRFLPKWFGLSVLDMPTLIQPYQRPWLIQNDKVDKKIFYLNV